MNLSAVLKADRIDNKMVVYSLNAAVVMCIQMRGDQNLVSWKRLPGKFQTDTVGFFVRLNFPRQKGLHILIEVSAAGFAVKIFGCHELFIRVLTEAVDTADILSSVFVNGFLLLHAVTDTAAHGTRRLLALLDENNGCHRTSASAPYHRIGVGIQLVDCLIAPTNAVRRCGQIDRPYNALMAKHGELIEISADAFQLMKDWLEFLYLVDRLSECRDAKVFTDAHAGTGGNLFNCFPFALCHPKGLFSVSFATFGRHCKSPLFLL